MSKKFTELSAYTGAPDSADVFALADISENVNKKLAYADLISQAVAAAKLMGNIITVAQSGGQYADLSDAIAAASDNDVILIYPGSYNLTATKNIAGKTLMGYGIDSKITANADIPPFTMDLNNKTTVLKNLNIEGNETPVFYNGIENKGTLIIENCYLSSEYTYHQIADFIPTLRGSGSYVLSTLVLQGNTSATGMKVIIRNCKFYNKYTPAFFGADLAHSYIYQGPGVNVYAVNNSDYHEKGISTIKANGIAYTLGGISPIILDGYSDPVESYYGGMYHNNKFTIQTDSTIQYQHRLMGILITGAAENCIVSGSLMTLICENYHANTVGYAVYLNTNLANQVFYAHNFNVRILNENINRYTGRAVENTSVLQFVNGSINAHAIEDIQSGDGFINGTMADAYGFARTYDPPLTGYAEGSLLRFHLATERWREISPGLQDQVLTMQSGIPSWQNSRIRNWFQIPNPSLSYWTLQKQAPSSFGYSFVDRGLWTTATGYSVGDIVHTAASPYIYQCIVAGTSSVAPTGTQQGYDELDGTLKWRCRASNVLMATGLAGFLQSVKIHTPIKFLVGANWHYGQILKFTEGPNSYIEFSGPSVPVTDIISEVWVGSPYLMLQDEINIPTTYGDSTTKTLLKDDRNMLKKYGRLPDGYLVGAFMQHIIDAGTTQPLMNITLNGNTVIMNANSLDADGGIYPTAAGSINYPTAIHPTYYKITQGQLFDISCEVAGTPTSGARNLLVCWMMVLDYVN